MLQQPLPFTAESQFYLVENNQVVGPFTEAEARRRAVSGYSGPVMRQGDQGWKTPADYGLVARAFYAVITPNHPAGGPFSEEDIKGYIASGWWGPIAAAGEQAWKQPNDYGFAAPAPSPPVGSPPAAARAAPVAPAPAVAPTPAAPVAATSQPGPTPVSVVASPVPAYSGPTALQMLREFAKQPGCEAYKSDGDRIRLISIYVWVREFAEMSFSDFLLKFAKLADFDETNRKHPDDALDFHCPRHSKKATARGVAQWSAKEVADFAALYIEHLKECEVSTAGHLQPLNFDAFLQTHGAAYLAGQLKHPEPVGAVAEAVKRTARKGGSAVVPDVVIRPTQPGQRVVCTSPTGQQRRGVVHDVVTDVSGTGQVISGVFDGGEAFDMLPSSMFHVTNDPLPTPPAATLPDGQPRASLTASLHIAKSNMPRLRETLSLTVQAGNVELGGVIWPFAKSFSDGVEAVLEVVNGETGPYVDARLREPRADTELQVLPPRKEILGSYQFDTPRGVYTLDVRTSE